MVFSCRTVPPTFHKTALQEFDNAVHACFEQFSCLHPSGDHWLQATLSTDKTGLGLRSLAQHSSAAFLASRTSCHKLCRDLDSNHTFHTSDLDNPSHERLALQDFNDKVNASDQLQVNLDVPLKQKNLSTCVDTRTLMHLTDPDRVPAARRAHLNLLEGTYLSVAPQEMPTRRWSRHSSLRCCSDGFACPLLIRTASAPDAMAYLIASETTP